MELEGMSGGLELMDKKMMLLLRETLYPGASDKAIAMVIEYCRALNLDPMMKPVHIVRMGDSERLMPGIGLYRTQAIRSACYAGLSEPIFGPMVTEEMKKPIFKWCKVQKNALSSYNKRVIDGYESVQITYPEWCKLSAKKLVDGHIFEFVALEYWKENYATIGRDSDFPNEMWLKRPYGQLAKCFSSDTEVLTNKGFQRFDSVTGAILQVTDCGLSVTDAIPFVQKYDGEMIEVNGSRLNFRVTPNHDMILKNGKIEAYDLYNKATTDSGIFKIPMTIHGTREDYAGLSDDQIKLTAYFLCDGSHTGFKQFRISVSKDRKIVSLYETGFFNRVSIQKSKGDESIINGNRIIRTRKDKICFTYNFKLISSLCDSDKNINIDTFMNFSARQAKIFIKAMLESDGSFNGTTFRFYNSNPKIIAAFELAAIIAGYSVSKPKIRTDGSHKKSAYIITISTREYCGITRKLGRRTDIKISVSNSDAKVWCVTVPSGAIIVRRNGFSMICGNCTESQVLRKICPEFVPHQPTYEEMEGKFFFNGSKKELIDSDKVCGAIEPKLERKPEEIQGTVEEDLKLKQELIDYLKFMVDTRPIDGTIVEQWFVKRKLPKNEWRLLPMNVIQSLIAKIEERNPELQRAWVNQSRLKEQAEQAHQEEEALLERDPFEGD